MAEVGKFQNDHLIQKLEDISELLDRPVSAYLIGGLAMGTYGLKETTKDVDLVFKTTNDAETFIRTIRKSGYLRKNILDDIYSNLGADGIFTSKSGHSFDIFIKQVCRGLSLTDGIIRRSNFFSIEGKLDLHTASPEDIFLFKGITPRPQDLDDMFILLQRDLNWDIILDEINEQPDHFRWIGDLFMRTGELEEKFNVSIPFRNEIAEEAELSIVICSILEILSTRILSLEELQVIVEENEVEMTEKAVERLIGMGRVEVKEGYISMITDR